MMQMLPGKHAPPAGATSPSSVAGSYCGGRAGCDAFSTEGNREQELAPTDSF